MSVITDIRTLLDERSSAVFWTDQHIYDAANQAQLDIYASLKAQQGSAVMSLNSGQDIVSIPPTIMIPQYIEFNNKTYFPTTHAKLEQWNRAWRGEALAQPKWFVLWDWEHFRVWPRPDQGYDFTLWGVTWPSEFSASNESITADRVLQAAIAFRAASYLLELTQPLLAAEMARESAEYETRYKTRLRNRQSHRPTALKPGTAFTAAQSGVISLGRKFS
jgi:hypothetical protein